MWYVLYSSQFLPTPASLALKSNLIKFAYFHQALQRQIWLLVATPFKHTHFLSIAANSGREARALPICPYGESQKATGGVDLLVLVEVVQSNNSVHVTADYSDHVENDVHRTLML